MKKEGRKGRGRKNIGSALAAISTTLIVVSVMLLSQSLNEARPIVSTNSDNISITLYRTPTCSCCVEYEEYLRSSGVFVKTVILDQAQLFDLRRRIGIPSELFSCHTSIVESYFVEGHVPLEAILKLIAERPDIDGIALPGMPQGAPGMDGARTGTLQVYAAKGNSLSIFMEL